MLLTALVADGYLRREGVHGAEFHVLALISASGAMFMAIGQRPHRHLPRPRDPLHRPLRADRVQPPPGGLGRGRAQVLHPRRRSPRPSSSTASRSTYGATGSTNLTQIADFLVQERLLSNGLLLAGLALLLVGLRLQGGGRAVPHVDARRLPGRAVAGDRLHGGGGQGGRLRRAAPGASSRPSASSARDWRRSSTGSPCVTLVLGAGRGAAPARRQADAGLLVDQPRRLHPPRRAGRHGPRRRARRSTTSSPTCS